MHSDHVAVFLHFAMYDVAIVGSSLQNMEKAKDIDVLFGAHEDFRQLARELGIGYRGGFDTPKGRVRQMRYQFGDLKPLNLVQRSSVVKFSQWPHAVLLRDGTLINPGVHYDKGRLPAQIVQ